MSLIISVSYYLLFSLQQNWRRGRNRFCLGGGEGGRGEVAQTMYTHVNKCKNKIKKEKKI
jgi:hypothetical protein